MLVKTPQKYEKYLNPLMTVIVKIIINMNLVRKTTPLINEPTKKKSIIFCLSVIYKSRFVLLLKMYVRSSHEYHKVTKLTMGSNIKKKFLPIINLVII